MKAVAGILAWVFLVWGAAIVAYNVQRLGTLDPYARPTLNIEIGIGVAIVGGILMAASHHRSSGP
jgi:hypothetical protein